MLVVDSDLLFLIVNKKLSEHELWNVMMGLRSRLNLCYLKLD